jgi:hypothetical protein
VRADCRLRTRLICPLISLLAWVPVRPATALSPAWKALEAHQATITEIVVTVQPVFDLSRPQENNWLGRTADLLHRPTREAVLRRALLFKPGDPVHARTIYETERLLRSLPFIKDAHILPETSPGGGVRAHVIARDAWTLQVDANLQKIGGQQSLSFGIQDQNLLGSGKTLGFNVSKDHERRASGLYYRDPQFLDSRWTLQGRYQVLSDGYARAITLERPFFALDTPWSALFDLQTRKADLAVYDRSKAVFVTPAWANAARLGAAWAIHQDEDHALRAGVLLRMDDRRYGPLSVAGAAGTLPAPDLPGRRQRGPALTLAYERDAYESFRNIRGMDTPEDYNLVWEGSLEAGSYTRQLGSTLPGPYAQLLLTKGWSQAPDQLTLFQGVLRARGGGIAGERLRLDANLASYLQLGPSQQLAGYLGISYADHPYPENLSYMGGTEGLRGYPNFLHPGDARWLLSVEHRSFTEQRWWSLFRLGYVVFVDAGAVRRLDGNGWSPTYPNLGAGLRLGDLKSSLARVLVLSVAAPLARQPGQSKWQFGIANVLRF